MKYTRLFALAVLVIATTVAATSDHFLLAENFFLHKGDKLNVRVYTSLQDDAFDDYLPATPTSSVFTVYEGSKKFPLPALPADSAARINNYDVQTPGLVMLHLKQEATNETDKEVFIKHLEGEAQEDALKKAQKATTMKVLEKYHIYLKTLVRVDKNSGSVYEKQLTDDYELVLKNNPYKMNYGDDIAAIAYFKGKPVTNENLMLFIKTPKGTVYPQKLVTDAAGQVFIKLSREGIYILRGLHTEAATGNDADFESWFTSFTFAFSSANELPNSYKEFGFGDYH